MASETNALEWLQFAVTLGTAVATGVIAYLVWRRDNSSTNLAIRDALLSEILDMKARLKEIDQRMGAIHKLYEKSPLNERLPEEIRQGFSKHLPEFKNIIAKNAEHLIKVDRIYQQVANAKLGDALTSHMRTNHMVQAVKREIESSDSDMELMLADLTKEIEDFSGATSSTEQNGLA